MRIQETVRKPMTEAKYLNVDNTDRYRPIIRLFYLKYEKLKYWLYQEEVYEELKEDVHNSMENPETFSPTRISTVLFFDPFVKVLA